MITQDIYEVLKKNIATVRKAADELSEEQLIAIYSDSNKRHDYGTATLMASIIVARYEAANTVTP